MGVGAGVSDDVDDDEAETVVDSDTGSLVAEAGTLVTETDTLMLVADCWAVLDNVEEGTTQVFAPHVSPGLHALHRWPTVHLIAGKSQHTALAT